MRPDPAGETMIPKGEILPCPFCGVVLSINNANLGVHPRFSDCLYAHQVVVIDDPAQVQRWNTRAIAFNSPTCAKTQTERPALYGVVPDPVYDRDRFGPKNHQTEGPLYVLESDYRADIAHLQAELSKAGDFQPLIDQVGEAYKFLALCRADKSDDAVETFALRDAYEWLRTAAENLGKALQPAQPAKDDQCKRCAGSGTVSTGIEESPTSICDPCNGTGKVKP